MIAVRDHPELTDIAHVVVVTFTDDLELLTAHRAHLGVTFDVVTDRSRALYGMLGAQRGSRRAVWSPGTLAMYARLLSRGRRLRRPTEDTRQLGADLVVGSDGVIRRIWLPQGPDDRPSVDALVDALREG